MKTQHHTRMGRSDLSATMHSKAAKRIDDMDFFETLARNRCMVMPPWVYHIDDTGHLEQVTAVRYTREYELDKASMLRAVMERLPRRTPPAS